MKKALTTRENVAKMCQTAYIMNDTNVSCNNIENAKDEAIVNDDVFLDNLPQTANYILNVLWDRNVQMTVAELTEAVNDKYGTQWERKDIQKFVRALVNGDYLDAKRKGLRLYYCPLGWEEAQEYL